MDKDPWVKKQKCIFIERKQGPIISEDDEDTEDEKRPDECLTEWLESP